ncbi:Crp/Fnr family transcriptional regulator [Amycolatopsis albispora]|uniref:Crp/Fnr family transcriptional regulator n=1 Tax=Amycolatopsis albispora TaxID=1804986 RepID=UPI000DE3EDA7|nr:Crp/Fnr family transcriptional regulator [Amycolatopsis albispora]
MTVGQDAEVPFGTRIGKDFIAELRLAGTRRPFTRGELLFIEGSAPANVFYIETGSVKVHVHSPDGDELILGVYGPGDLLCEMSALERGPRSASGTGRTTGSVTAVPCARFRALVHQNPAAMMHVLSIVQARLRRADRERLSYLSDDVSARVARKLLEWARRYGTSHSDGRQTIIKFSRKELAQSVAASEKTVDDVLTELCDKGLLSTGRLRFELLNPGGLVAWALARSRV